MYAKISKIVLLVLILLSIAVIGYGSYTGFSTNNGQAVDLLLNWGFFLFGSAVGLVVLLGVIYTGIIHPKSLAKTCIGVLVLCGVVLIAYLTAGGDPLVGYLGVQPSPENLKLTDTILNMTYILACGAILSIVVSEVLSIVRKNI